MSALFSMERQGQIEFYDLLNKIDGTIPLYDDFTDGIVKGTILEFKLKIDNINSVLLQTIKYLSKKGIMEKIFHRKFYLYH